MTANPALHSLAGAARESLATCSGSTLHVDGLNCARELSTEALVHDDDGCPTFVCDPDSPLVAAARNARAAVFAVLAGSPRAGVAELTGLVLAGRLRVTGTDLVDEATIVTVRLEVASVVAQHEGAGSPGASVEIPLRHYRAARQDAVHSAAVRIAAHTNQCHAAELRAAAARCSGAEPEEIAAAEVSEIDPRGVTLHWVDSIGAHTLRIAFPEEADSPRTLATHLRRALGTGGH